MISILKKAKELGDEIASSKELEEMKSAQLAVMQDPEAQAIVKEFQEKQKTFYLIQQQGHELTESQKKEVEELEQKMTNNPLIARYIKTQQRFEKLLEEINNIIAQSISDKHSCSDSCCSSCNGGCDA